MIKGIQAWDVLHRFFRQTNLYNVTSVEFDLLQNGPEIQTFDRSFLNCINAEWDSPCTESTLSDISRIPSQRWAVLTF